MDGECLSCGDAATQRAKAKAKLRKQKRLKKRKCRKSRKAVTIIRHPRVRRHHAEVLPGLLGGPAGLLMV